MAVSRARITRSRRAARRPGPRRGAHPPRARCAASSATDEPATSSPLRATTPRLSRASSSLPSPIAAHATRELLGAAARLAPDRRSVVAITVERPHADAPRRVGRRRSRAPGRGATSRKTSRARSPSGGRANRTAVGDPHAVDRVGSRGRVTRRGAPRRRSHRRCGRPRGRRRPARRVEAGVRRPARRRDRRDVGRPDGDRSRRHAPDARAAAATATSSPAFARSRCRARVACACSPARETTTSTPSPKRRRSSASAGRRTRRVPRDRTAARAARRRARRDPQGHRRGLAPRVAPDRASPAGRSRRACS